MPVTRQPLPRPCGARTSSRLAWTSGEQRAVKPYALADGSGLDELRPSRLGTVLSGARLRFCVDEVNARHPTNCSRSSCLPDVDVATWQDGRGGGRAALAPLTDALVAENFDFYGRPLPGPHNPKPRKRGVGLVEESLARRCRSTRAALPPARKDRISARRHLVGLRRTSTPRVLLRTPS